MGWATLPELKDKYKIAGIGLVLLVSVWLTFAVMMFLDIRQALLASTLYWKVLFWLVPPFGIYVVLFRAGLGKWTWQFITNTEPAAPQKIDPPAEREKSDTPGPEPVPEPAGTGPDQANGLAGHDDEPGDEPRAMLTDAAWIQAHLVRGQLPGLISDPSSAADPLTHEILRALRLSTAALAADPTQIPAQLVGRLMDHPDPRVVSWVRNLIRHEGSAVPWLISLTPALTPTTGSLEQVLTGHTDWVNSVAVTADGRTAVSGGDDGPVRVWDLAAGQQQAALTGHAGRVFSVAVTADGRTAVSGGDDGPVRVWDLAAGGSRPSSLATSAGRRRSRSRRTGPRPSAAAGTGRWGCGTWSTADGRPCSTATRAGLGRLQSLPTGQGRSAAATTGRCECGICSPTVSTGSTAR